MTQTATELIEKAKTSKLSSDERRICVAHIMQTDPTRSNYALAEEFQCSEGAIRNDKREIRERISEELRSSDVGLVVVDAFMTIARQVRDLERAKKKMEERGNITSREYLNACKSLVDIQLDFIELQQNLGYLPKNLGQMQVNKFEYAAVLQPDNSVEARPVNMFDPADQKKVAGIKKRAGLIAPEPAIDIERVPAEIPVPKDNNESIESTGGETPEE